MLYEDEKVQIRIEDGLIIITRIDAPQHRGVVVYAGNDTSNNQCLAVECGPGATMSIGVNGTQPVVFVS